MLYKLWYLLKLHLQFLLYRRIVRERIHKLGWLPDVANYRLLNHLYIG